LVDTILEESGYYEKWKNDKSPDAPGKLENLSELIRGMEAFENLEELGNQGLEEERRLAYVGITRAKKRAHIFYAASRYMFGNYMSPIPSRFIAELPDEHVEKHGQQGLSSLDHGTFGRSFDAPPNLGFNFGEGRENYQLDRSKAKKRPTSSARKAPVTKSSISIGDRVFHDKFGYGKVTSIDGNKLVIDFEMGSVRKVMDSFINPA